MSEYERPFCEETPDGRLVSVFYRFIATEWHKVRRYSDDKGETWGPDEDLGPCKVQW